MFSISANAIYSFEDDKHSIEVSYADSDGTNVGAYAEGDAFDKVLLDVIDQLDEATAEHDDDQADVEESAALEEKIADLQAQVNSLTQEINSLTKENESLKARHNEKIRKEKEINFNNLFTEDFLNKISMHDADWDKLFRHLVG